MRATGVIRAAVVLAGLAGAGLAAPAGAQSPPLALRQASLRAAAGGLALRLGTTGPWTPAELAAAGDRALCVLLWAGDRATARSRVCVASTGDRLALRVDRLAPDGTTTATSTLPDAGRPDDRSVAATFTGRQAGVPEPVLFWRATSRWGTCGGPCQSKLPATGRRTLDLRPPATTLAGQLGPPEHPDSRDTPAGPLDVRAAAFGQRELRLVLRLRTRGAWSLGQLRGDRRLCVVLGTRRGTAPPVGRLCLGRGRRGAILRYERIDTAGLPGRPTVVPATVSRPDPRSVRASVSPRALGLPRGRFTWAVESRWRDGAGCRAGCADRVPDSGAFAGSLGVLAEPRCFAAAARDPLHPCANPILGAVVHPKPEDAYVWPNSPCRPMAGGTAVFDPCAFGVAGSPRAATVALVGDSHATHWRAALEVVAQARGWRGVSITRPGCPFSTQIPASVSLGPADCAQLHRDTLAWLRHHPGVRTVFVSDWAEPAGGPQGGTGGYGGGASAFGAMLDRLPASVRRVYVLRDVPATTIAATTCVERRLRRRQRVGPACWSPRSAVLTPDPGAAAARARAPRMRVIDLTRHFCGPTRCYAVIGGAYVHKDDNHMNAVFSTSLGPYVLRALGRG